MSATVDNAALIETLRSAAKPSCQVPEAIADELLSKAATALEAQGRALAEAGSGACCDGYEGVIGALQQVIKDQTALREAAEDVLRKFLDYANADYVPNTLFDRARSVLENGPAGLADATPNQSPSSQDQEIAGLRAALEKIAAIEDEATGGGWEEIEKARQIARSALSPLDGEA